jgi:hypothetical protein
VNNSNLFVVGCKNYIHPLQLEITGIWQAIRSEIPQIKSEQQKFLVCENAENFCFTQHKTSLFNKPVKQACLRHIGGLICCTETVICSEFPAGILFRLSK